ncbi:glycogen debranching N-terminal domain-containing protein [soil metagenome]
MLADRDILTGGGTVGITAADGTIAPDGVAGVYHGDRRVLSHLRWAVPDHRCDLLDARRTRPDQRQMHWGIEAGTGVRRALISTMHTVDGGLHLEMTVRAFDAAITLDVTTTFATDLADLLTLRYGAAPPRPLSYRLDGDRLLAGDTTRGVAITAPGATFDTAGTATWTMTVEPATPQVLDLHVHPLPAPAAVPAIATGPTVIGDHRWTRATTSALADLAALRMHDAERGLTWIGAGAPWYMALFGRDALLTAHEALIAGIDLALDVLDALAQFQGTADDPATGEAPGKILHELRTGHSGVFGLAPWQPYFGSVDATPLFVVALAAAFRWGAPVERVRSLLPAARAAVGWCRTTATADAHRWLTYLPDAAGLHNQGWKDSPDAMVHADGSRADGPIAVIDAQAYHWRALTGLAALETAIGDPDTAADLHAEAADLRTRLIDDFRSGTGCVFAMARDGDGRRLEVASSNTGHLLWTGTLAAPHADALADRLLARDMHAGWGIRTLSADATAYDPLSYHRGSIWPHDTALVIAGIARTGRQGATSALVDGVLALAEHTRWRLPELIAGYGTDTVDTPVPYPVACSPQAWSAAVPLALLTTLLQLEPNVPAGELTIGPCLDPRLTLDITGIRLGAHRLDVSVDRGRITATADPPLQITVRR